MIIIFYGKTVPKYCLPRGYLLVLRPFLVPSDPSSFRKELPYLPVTNANKKEERQRPRYRRKESLEGTAEGLEACSYRSGTPASIRTRKSFRPENKNLEQEGEEVRFDAFSLSRSSDKDNTQDRVRSSRSQEYRRRNLLIDRF